MSFVPQTPKIRLFCKTLPLSLALLEIEEWNHVLNVNLNGTFLMTKHIIPAMIEKKSGAIVNISSIAALVEGSNKPPAAYGASKGASYFLV